MLKIGSLPLDNWLIMAPMAGITSLPFRLIVKRLGAGLVTTEMVSAVGLDLGQKRTLEYLKSRPDEKPLAVQIFGSNPCVMARAARIVMDSGADLIDINMGCPVKKVVKTGAGASLLRDPIKIAEIVSAVRQASSVPISVKIRAGWSRDRPVACEIAKVVEDCGADAVTVHPRFASDSFSGQADWALIGEVKTKVAIPVIGNGDVFEPLQAIEMRKKTGCDGVMIGRGAVKNPWIFRQILSLSKGLPVQKPDLNERRSFILEHFNLLVEQFGETKSARIMRGLLLRYTKGLPFSGRFRETINEIHDFESLVRTMDDYLSQLQEDKRH